MIDLGVLEQLVNAMYALGCDENTSVEYAEDDGQGSLEVVEEDEYSTESCWRAPRVVGMLFEGERGAHWRDSDGDGWRWNGYAWLCAAAPDHFDWIESDPRECYGPYTEIMP